MFQTFTSPADSALVPERIKRVRALFAEAGLAALLVPRGDEHQGEYVPPSAERLKWLTGFSGSAGIAAVTKRRAAVFVDGRYMVQVRAECDPDLFDFPGLARPALVAWLTDSLKRGDAIGFDPALHTIAEIRRLGDALAPAGLTLKATATNLVDRAWGKDRPSPPAGAVMPHPLKYAGRSTDAKIASVQKAIKDAGHDAVVLTQPDSICWLLNIRGRDVAHNPIALCFAIVPAKGKPELFISPAKLTTEARAHLAGDVTLSPPAALKSKLVALRKHKAKVQVDPERCGYWIGRILGKSIASGADPCTALKAVKNAAEIKGARTAHVRDGAAVSRFLAWLDHAAVSGKVDEITAVRELEAARAATQALKEISFDTISGSGANGAIVHYRVTEASNRKLRAGELFLLDSGAQYIDGTTDITRTVAIGSPSAEMKQRFTLVLKGHIAIATARFPKGTRGVDLDPFARRALWEHGLDYDHGTGHGVGSYLSVHEGPQSISRAGMVALEPGMIISNEPGYYKEGAYGIRIENLVLVTPPETSPGGERETMGFETLTLVPFDRSLIVKDMLTREEIEWIDSYHVRVREKIGPESEPETLAWIETATRPL